MGEEFEMSQYRTKLSLGVIATAALVAIGITLFPPRVWSTQPDQTAMGKLDCLPGESAKIRENGPWSCAPDDDAEAKCSGNQRAVVEQIVVRMSDLDVIVQTVEFMEFGQGLGPYLPGRLGYIAFRRRATGYKCNRQYPTDRDMILMFYPAGS